MTLKIAVPPLSPMSVGRLRPMIVIRILLAAAALCLVLSPAFSAERLRLRGAVTVDADVLTLADLAEGASGAAAEAPLFRSPALGESGTIQARRIGEAAKRFGLGLDPAGPAQVLVTRAARRIEAAEIEAALRRALELRHGIDAGALSIVHDGGPPTLVVPPDVTAPVTIEELSFDRRSRRVLALATVAGTPSRPGASVRIGGAAIELVEVGVLNRALNRGETIQAADLAIERRPREGLPGDLQADAASLAGRIARRPLSAGAVVRTGDLGKPEIVARGDIVTVFYEVPGMTLTLRARATEAGAQGDTIAVLNVQSKKSLHATVVAPGRVAVSAATPGPLARLAAQTPSP
jgi:flagellar basal body P-ring formation protein FlgA